jgi:hypothetical protein|tara:strand:+ start:352 stop:513 length:162 start_codon:yes stop_codon:yes gene_type:complete
MLTKIVNGQEVQCTPEEEAQIRAEWAHNDTNRPLSTGTPSLQELIEKAILESK